MQSEREEPSKETTRDEAHFIALVKEGGAYAVPLPAGGATAWAGGMIRTLWYQHREAIGNELLASGKLRFGEPRFGSNAVQIEVVE